jgi:hypothetical protein
MATYPTSGDVEVNLGWEPQFVLYKDSGHSGPNWTILDTMRGWAAQKTGGTFSNITGGPAEFISANSSNAASSTDYGGLTSTGFKLPSNANYEDGNTKVIYMAIRRPMKVPTTGTSVFSPIAYTGDATNRVLSTGFPVDMTIISDRNNSSSLVGYKQFLADRLQGNANAFATAYTDPWGGGWGNTYFDFRNNTGLNLSSITSGYLNNTSTPYVAYNFSRRPGFFDQVVYTGTGSARTVTHNLTVVPELMIVKSRSNASPWMVYAASLGNTTFLRLNENIESQPGSGDWNSTTPTSTVFSVGSGIYDTNVSGYTYVAYLFATCPGVSKVGSYTGNGSTQAIACGFTGGARFVLIKRTDSTGGWYVYDTARGMTTLTDPYLLMNSTAAETATLGSVTTTTGGFTVDASILAAINTNAASYIFLAIA